MDFPAGVGACAPVQDPRTGIPRLWLSLLAPLPNASVPPLEISSLHIHPRGTSLDPMFGFSVLPGFVEIFLTALVV